MALKANGAATITQPARGLMKEQAYTEIKRFILNGDLAAGSFLAERQLAEQLEMSKTPVRAALERLEAEGLITISPQQGIIVRDLTIHEIADQYEIRAALETYIVRTVAGKLTAAQVERLKTNLKEQEALVETRDVERGVALDAAFHTLFAEFLGNAEILRIMAQLREKIHRVITKVFQINAGRMLSSCGEHKAIADAVIAGDGDSAAKLLEQHLDCGKQFLLSPRRTS
jgi:DNA-binding GntR family transcriptional regulator